VWLTLTTPTPQEAELERFMVQGQIRKKARPYLNKQARSGCASSNPSYEGGIDRRITVHLGEKKSTRPYLKNN
jgi:hypothetical protein